MIGGASVAREAKFNGVIDYIKKCIKLNALTPEEGKSLTELVTNYINGSLLPDEYSVQEQDKELTDLIFGFLWISPGLEDDGNNTILINLAVKEFKNLGIVVPPFLDLVEKGPKAIKDAKIVWDTYYAGIGMSDWATLTFGAKARLYMLHELGKSDYYYKIGVVKGLPLKPFTTAHHDENGLILLQGLFPNDVDTFQMFEEGFVSMYDVAGHAWNFPIFIFTNPKALQSTLAAKDKWAELTTTPEKLNTAGIEFAKFFITNKPIATLAAAEIAYFFNNYGIHLWAMVDKQVDLDQVQWAIKMAELPTPHEIIRIYNEDTIAKCIHMNTAWLGAQEQDRPDLPFAYVFNPGELARKPYDDIEEGTGNYLRMMVTVLQIDVYNHIVEQIEGGEKYTAFTETAKIQDKTGINQIIQGECLWFSPTLHKVENVSGPIFDNGILKKVALENLKVVPDFKLTNPLWVTNLCIFWSSIYQAVGANINRCYNIFIELLQIIPRELSDSSFPANFDQFMGIYNTNSKNKSCGPAERDIEDIEDIEGQDVGGGFNPRLINM